MKLKISLIILLLLLSVPFLSRQTLAQHFSSSSYNIDWGNFNITSGSKTSTNYSLTDTVGQNAPGPYTSSGYTLKSGFQYIYDTFNQFSFSIDNLSIALGTLTPGVGSTSSNIITITTPSGHGYQITAQQNHPLSLAAGTTIPDTKCDSGTCTITSSGIWTSSSSYGFGFNALGINGSGVVTNVGTSSYFTDSTYFRPFALLNNPQIFMSEDHPIKDHSARITYKTNVSPFQSAGTYQNSIIFTAVPKY